MASSSTEIYQSPGDRQRLGILLKTLRESGFNLAILGPDEITLAHYTRTIYEHLRQDPSLQVELWGSMDSEKLIERFNVILSELTVEQALDKSRPASVHRYLIFPDAQSVQDFELQLLARLINGFPASHLHVVLLINRNEPYEKKLDVFGKHLMRWTLESEHPEPTRMQRIETREEPDTPPAPAKETGFAWPPKSLEPTAPAADEGLPPAPAWMNESPGLADVGAPSAPSALDGDSTRRGSGSRVGWLLLLALALSAAVFGILYRDVLMTEVQALQDYIGGKKAAGKNPAVPSAEENRDEKGTPAQPPASVGISSTTTLPVKPDESLIPDKEALLPAAPAPRASESGAAGTAGAAAPQPAAVPPAKPVARAEATPEPAADPLDKSRTWVKELPSGSWVLQHAAMETLAEAQVVRTKTPGLQEAQIIWTRRKTGKAFYIVVTGPYANRQTAEAEQKKNPAMAKSWLRSGRALQGQLDE